MAKYDHMVVDGVNENRECYFYGGLRIVVFMGQRSRVCVFHNEYGAHEELVSYGGSLRRIDRLIAKAKAWIDERGESDAQLP